MAYDGTTCRYGRFTLKDARLLERCIEALEDLDEGRREARTAMQVQFLSVCKGKAPPRTRYETAYMRWRHSKPDISQVLERTAYARRALAKSGKPKPSPAGSARGGKATGTSPYVPGTRRKTKQAEAAHRVATGTLHNLPKKSFARKVHEPWGTREDWKRDRARNRYNGRE